MFDMLTRGSNSVSVSLFCKLKVKKKKKKEKKKKMFDLSVSNNESLSEIQVRSQRPLLPAGLTHYPVHTGTLGTPRLSNPIRSSSVTIFIVPAGSAAMDHV